MAIGVAILMHGNKKRIEILMISEKFYVFTNRSIVPLWLPMVSGEVEILWLLGNVSQ